MDANFNRIKTKWYQFAVRNCSVAHHCKQKIAATASSIIQLRASASRSTSQRLRLLTYAVHSPTAFRTPQYARTENALQYSRILQRQTLRQRQQPASVHSAIFLMFCLWVTFENSKVQHCNVDEAAFQNLARFEYPTELSRHKPSTSHHRHSRR